jgi:hypothetical protein
MSPDSLKFLLSLLVALGAVIAWFIDRRQRRAWEDYQRKEERYRELLLAIPGFYITTSDPQLKQTFLDQVNLCWLYCSDEVIRKAYRFLSTVHTDGGCDSENERSLGELILTIRKDLLARPVVNRTKLKAEDFKLFAPTKTP